VHILHNNQKESYYFRKIVKIETTVSKQRSVYTSKPAACIHTDKFMGMDFDSISICDLPPQLNMERFYSISKLFVQANIIFISSSAGSGLLKNLKLCVSK